jgi:hypothetical protein
MGKIVSQSFSWLNNDVGPMLCMNSPVGRRAHETDATHLLQKGEPPALPGWQ